MSFLNEMGSFWKYVYKIMGIIQFSADSKIAPHLWPLPLNIFFIYICYDYYMSINYVKFWGIFLYVDSLSTTTSILSMLTSIIVFYDRSNKIKFLLDKLDENTLQSEKTSSFNYLKITLVCSLLVHFSFYPFMEDPVIFSLIYIVPGIINCCDHLFLNDIFEIIYNKFELINQEFQRQTIFYHQIKTKNFIDTEIKLKLDQIEQLSLYHNDLIDLSLQINKHFEKTTIAAMIMWFVYVTNTLYFLLFSLIHYEYKKNSVILFGINFAYLMFFVFWLYLMLKMYTRTEKEVNY